MTTRRKWFDKLADIMAAADSAETSMDFAARLVMPATPVSSRHHGPCTRVIRQPSSLPTDYLPVPIGATVAGSMPATATRRPLSDIKHMYLVDMTMSPVRVQQRADTCSPNRYRSAHHKPLR